jgi:hypothetical protein
VLHDEADREQARVVAAYGVLNARASLRRSWGVEDDLVDAVRAELLAGGAANAAHLVPDRVVEDIAITDTTPARVGARAASIGASEMAVPADDVATVAERVAWARAVLGARPAS